MITEDTFPSGQSLEGRVESELANILEITQNNHSIKNLLLNFKLACSHPDQGLWCPVGIQTRFVLFDLTPSEMMQVFWGGINGTEQTVLGLLINKLGFNSKLKHDPSSSPEAYFPFAFRRDPSQIRQFYIGNERGEECDGQYVVISSQKVPRLKLVAETKSDDVSHGLPLSLRIQN